MKDEQIIQSMKAGFGSAPGKVIISGEHSVVYGFPAIAVAIGLRCRVISNLGEPGLAIRSEELEENYNYSIEQLTSLHNGAVINQYFDNIAKACMVTLNTTNLNLSLKISSDIPIGAGLGSSAAISVATICSITDLFDLKLSKQQISEIGYEAEKITHGNPSGIDNSVATFGGIIKFEDGKIRSKSLSNKIPLVIGNTQIGRNTKKLVEGVAELKEETGHIVDNILETMGSITNKVEVTFDDNNLELMGKLFDINQGLLDAIGVGHPALSDLIWYARKEGAIGSKLTGAGGGGCMISLARDDVHATRIGKILKIKGASVIITDISPDGAIVGRG